MSGVTKEQIAKAKEWDLLSYLQVYEPKELKRSGPNEYCTRTHDSLKISHGKWCWHSRGIGGRTALDYLIKVHGMSFVSAVEALSGASAPLPQPPVSLSPKPFNLPEKNRCGAAVVAYLQDRGISPELIGACMQAGTLYESRKYQSCVFVGKDPEGKPRSASLRSTRDDLRMDVQGSDKHYSFALLADDTNCPRLAVAESPIDALSLATLVKLSGGNWRDTHYLSLGGTALRAMMQFLRDHPYVTQVSLCLDNDKAGREGIARLEQAIQGDSELSQRVMLIHRNPPKQGKDYNEFLCTIIKKERVQQREEAR